MCGIAGIISYNNAPIEIKFIEQMTRALAHRGPDGEGFHLEKSIALGHRRLSIIDLELGNQPMCNEDGTVWITYNGELYNYRELRKDLLSLGHSFKTNSDTEVIIHSYEQWGEGCLEKFRGMFAFAIANMSARKVFLARDHFGIKPLYYLKGSGCFAFASELAALRLAGDETLSGNLEALDLYLRFQYIPAPHTIFRNVFKLLPAHFMVINFQGTIEKHKRYWTPRFNKPLAASREELLEKIDARVTESVKTHLVSDVPFGVFLSGGIDSTLIAWKMSEILGRQIAAFSIGFNEKEYSELAYAEKAAKELGITLQTEIVSECSLDNLPELVDHYGEPFGDCSIIPTWHVSRLARKSVPMVLSGDGGDEGFGGYDTYNYWMQSDPWGRARQMIMGMHPRSALRDTKRALQYRGIFSKPRIRVGEWEEIMTSMQSYYRRKLWKKGYRYLMKKPCGLFNEASRLVQPCDRFSFAQMIDFHTYLPCDILTKVDVASMYWGLEVRPPLIDRDLFELSASLPPAMKYEYKEGIFNGKLGLKGVLSKKFDSRFIGRPKQGFTIPRYTWFLPGAQASSMLKDIILSENPVIIDLFDISYVRTLMDAHGRDGRDHSGVLWLLLVLFIWFNNNKSISFS